MRVRLTAVFVGVVLASSLSSGSLASGQPVNPGAGGSVTREGAIADAHYGQGGGGRSFADTSQGGPSDGDTRRYDCSWNATSGGENDDPVTWETLNADYIAQGLTPPEPMYVPVYCTPVGSNELAPWSGPVEWTPDVTEPIPDVDPSVLADEAIDELTFPVPNGQTSPPLDSGSYAQLPTYFEVNDWVTLTASAQAGPITSTVTATPTQLEIVLFDNIGESWGAEPRSLGTADCSAPPPDSAVATCEWLPPHSSAGQTTPHPDTGEPCFEVVVLVEWTVTWEATGPFDPAYPTSGTLGSTWMGSSTCIVVAEIQAVVDDA